MKIYSITHRLRSTAAVETAASELAELVEIALVVAELELVVAGVATA